MRPLVSIGIPTFHRPWLLEKALSSVVNQTYKELDILVSDNCSDGCLAYQAVNKFNDSRIKYVRQEKRLDVNENFFYTRENTKSQDFFMWLGDDDFISDTYIENCINAFKKEGGLASVGTEIQYYTRNGGILPTFRE